MPSTLNRITGLASGLDTETMVNDLMKAQRMRLDSLKQDRTVLGWKQADYRSIRSLLRDLRDSTFSMKLEGTFLSKKVSSSDESKVTATAVASASEGTYDISVTKLASSETKVSSTSVSSAGVTIDPTASLWSQRSKFADAEPLFPATSAEGDQFSFTLNGKVFTFRNTDSLNTVISTVNSDADAGVVMFYDTYENKLSITTKATGDNKPGSDEIVLGTEGFVRSFQMDDAVKTGGENAQFTINGLSTQRTSNSFTINGVTVTLKNTTAVGESIRVDVTRDKDAIFTAVKNWVDKYNSTIEGIYKELNEERFAGYEPLTDDQMQQLTDKQIDMWEEKAKSGLLKHDSLVSGAVANIRMAVFRTVSGLDEYYNNLADIGITTGDYTENGKLYIDEAELKKAIDSDPDKVMQLFTSNGTGDAQGIAGRIYDVIGSEMKRIEETAGLDSDLVDDSFIGNRIREINKRISAEEDRLQRVEDRYWRQFTALEKWISQMNTQSAWLMQQFGGGQA